MNRISVKEMGIALSVIVVSVCLYMAFALQFINRESDVKLLFCLMSIWMMTTMLMGLLIAIVRTTMNINTASEKEDCELWVYLLGRTMSCVALILTGAMAALTVAALMILEVEQKYTGLGMGAMTLVVCTKTIKLCQITKKEITFSVISFELDR